MLIAPSLAVINIISVLLASVLIGTLILYELEQRDENELLRNELNARTSSEFALGTKDIKKIVESTVDKKIEDLRREVQKLQLSASLINDIEGEACQHLTEVKNNEILAKINFADILLGARIQEVTATGYGAYRFWPFGSNFGKNSPENILNSEMEPGACFAFVGKASVTIRIAKLIYIDSISLEHITECIAPTKNISSAPKNFQVFGIDNGINSILLGEFKFDHHMVSQVFPIERKGKQHPFQFIKYVFLTNHGHPEYTCVYRVGVYGNTTEPKS